MLTSSLNLSTLEVVGFVRRTSKGLSTSAVSNSRAVYVAPAATSVVEAVSKALMGGALSETIAPVLVAISVAALIVAKSVERERRIAMNVGLPVEHEGKLEMEFSFAVELPELASTQRSLCALLIEQPARNARDDYY
ncbi:uncharacterized protein PHALS_09148 [Plasmopara halstedii]|uniref:Uncharacterized protein n=1 Tax=Plasmopara halstedii TaxID=4781 RepID=A0A0P1AE88_PLAHL|nr:uncharacterized protein PHALS_09148 [Plasmopara halstedii]CEG39086.1 hypothetical protein PHALS_09148 [Plasmopara halstedii]|eukprot:XP_024575455.1 hypothetical protein PHALS_09148 [Plasmopara halstedii]